MKPLKRALDLLCAVPGTLLLSPLLLLTALLIRLTDRGPIFFRQERVGFRGRPFRIWKFRTMVVDAERRGAQITVGPDPRITRIGVLLRKLKIDELPQLFNVLAGEMSMVGPRPEVPHYVAMYSEEQRRVLDLMPGITDEASIAYRNENDILAAAADAERTYVEEIMPEKIRLNLRYAAHANVFTDVGVILRTLVKVLG
jgi:lipopolysaccharide/colanic/teichoic acid biosynthesis glycosyltransferase